MRVCGHMFIVTQGCASAQVFPICGVSFKIGLLLNLIVPRFGGNAHVVPTTFGGQPLPPECPADRNYFAQQMPSAYRTQIETTVASELAHAHTTLEECKSTEIAVTGNMLVKFQNTI